MSILVVDQSPELFWFVSNALIQTELSIKQVPNIEAGERIILQELPDIVVLNGDDKTLLPDQFINRMRNHVFARNTMFIVFTANTSSEFKKTLLLAGATQILYRGQGFGPSLKFFSQFIKWCLNFKNPNPNIFEYKSYPFNTEADFTSFGRIGWLSKDHCLIETNVDLNEGQSIEVTNQLFDELKIKNVKLECLEKNKVGRYYQYANSLLCKMVFEDQEKDLKKIGVWTSNNLDISKNKPIKLVYFEDSPIYREVIKQMIKSNKRYCARGYKTLKDISENLSYQMPHLILVNRSLIEKERKSFEKIRSFLKDHFCYCLTYSTEDESDTTNLSKDFDFAMHVPKTIDLPLLESMILKLEAKLPSDSENKEEKIYFNKYSPYGRISLHSKGELKEIALTGAGLILPFGVSNFSSCEVSCNSFKVAGIDSKQMFRTFSNQNSASGMYHRIIFMGQNIKDNDLIKETITQLELVGYDQWLEDKKTKADGQT